MLIWRLLFDPRGIISRTQFALIAFMLVPIKIAGDFAIAQFLFHRTWNLREYFFSHLTFLFDATPGIWKFDALLLLWAAPFAWIGLSLLAKRLRSARAPIALVILFFVPIAKFFLFALLCVLPERVESDSELQLPPRHRKWVPESSLASAAIAVICSTLVGVILAVLATWQMRNYTTWLFLGLPFLMGFLSAWLHGLARPRKLRESFAAAYLTLAITSAILLSIAVEGIICLGMAAPIALCEATIGAWIAHSIQRTSGPNGSGNGPVAIACLTLPLLILIESLGGISPIEFAVTSQVAIEAPPEIVWRHVISFHELPPPREWIFRLGIAYPERAEIDGSGVGALRHCIFSTGEFLEPITTWDEPNRLGCGIVGQPDPLSELSPYRNLRPPHMDGYFNSHRGEFRLCRIGSGTMLFGTTWYSNRMEPQLYWKLWSDGLIHRIHLRVLEQIRREAEAEVTANFDSTVESADRWFPSP